MTTVLVTVFEYYTTYAVSNAVIFTAITINIITDSRVIIIAIITTI